MEVDIKTNYIDERVELVLGRYGNGDTAIQGFSLDGQPAFKATVSVLGEKPAKGCVFLKGWSENEMIPDCLVKAGIVTLTGRTVKIGHCEAIEAKLCADLT